MTQKGRQLCRPPEGRLTDKTKKKRVFSLYLSPAFDIGACQGILELLNTRGHGWQRWCPRLLVSILVARRGFGQCVCINCLLESVHRAGSAQVNVKGYRKITPAHFQAFSKSVWLCKKKKKRKVWFLCLCSTRKYLIIRNLFRLNLGKRCVSPESNAGQPTETPSWWIPLLSASCEWICTKLTGDQRHPRTSRTKKVPENLVLWVQGCRTPLFALVFSTHPCIFTVEKGPTHSAHLQNIL